MKSNSATAVTRFLVFLFVSALSFGGFFLWWNDSTRAVDEADTTPISFTVSPGDGAKAIATNLAQDNLIRSPTAFFIQVKFLGLEKKLQAGSFRLSKSMDSTTIAQQLTHGFEDVWLTTLEGWRNEEVAAVVSKTLDIPESEFLRAARLGYMFPDTYRVPKDATAGAVVSILRSTFDAKITDAMRSSMQKHGLTLEQAVVLASIVEREGNSDSDRPMIAGILLKRLKADWPLQADATLQYALGYQSQEKSWWKKSLTDADRSVVSVYNTYAHTGLPPSPICNPGLSSLTAVAYPKDSPYWYYIHDPQGNAHYAKTLEEHTANIQAYLQ